MSPIRNFTDCAFIVALSCSSTESMRLRRLRRLRRWHGVLAEFSTDGALHRVVLPVLSFESKGLSGARLPDLTMDDRDCCENGASSPDGPHLKVRLKDVQTVTRHENDETQLPGRGSKP
ncbi:hypothetical protein E4U52_002494 [Claviceps spartinae]|nr:hypothetical protein E4U52_002494 [Claviceps spartinae]